MLPTIPLGLCRGVIDLSTDETLNPFLSSLGYEIVEGIIGAKSLQKIPSKIPITYKAADRYKVKSSEMPKLTDPKSKMSQEEQDDLIAKKQKWGRS